MASEPELPKKALQDLMQLASRMAELHKQLESKGVFVGERDLLECDNCTLMEDVMMDGHLVTYFRPAALADFHLPLQGQAPADLGLHFEKLEENHFACPVCGKRIKLDPEASLDNWGTADE